MNRGTVHLESLIAYWWEKSLFQEGAGSLAS